MNLQDVVARWSERYAASGDRDDKLTTPGYPDEQISVLETRLGIEFHPSFKRVLRMVNLDTASFRRASFSGGTDYLEGLWFINVDLSYKIIDARFITVGGYRNYNFILDNQNGNILTQEMYDSTHKMDFAASDLEQMICLLATVADENWPQFSSYEEALEAGSTYLEQAGITESRRFRLNLIASSV